MTIKILKVSLKETSAAYASDWLKSGCQNWVSFCGLYQSLGYCQNFGLFVEFPTKFQLD